MRWPGRWHLGTLASVSHRRNLAFSAVAGIGMAALAACSSPASQPPKQSELVSPSQSASTPSPTVNIDLTEPGAAENAIDELLRAAGSTDVLMVSAKRRDATVSVLIDGRAETWSFRRGTPQQVETDLAYVDQSTFDVDEWDLSDLGALFRAADAVSGSSSGQELQIVDASGGLIRMSVSTNPESRTVFFDPDGTLVPTLDLTSEWGLSQAYQEVVGSDIGATEVGFSDNAVYMERPVSSKDSTLRRTRTSWVPVTAGLRPGQPGGSEFVLPRNLPKKVWAVVAERHASGEFELDQPWECTVSKGSDGVRMRFAFGSDTFTTDGDGQRITP